MRRLLLAACLLASPAFAQAPSPDLPGTEPAPVPDTPSSPGQAGAQQVVGLFMATCMQFGGNRDQLRGWLQQQGARQLPQAARDVFLQKRPGAVYDASYQQTRLALVSLDNGDCEAVVEFADAPAVLSELARAFAAGGIPATSDGIDQADPKNPALHRRVFTIKAEGAAGHQATIIAATASRGTPQAVLTLLPR